MNNQTNQDQADGKFDRNIASESMASQGLGDDDEQAGSVYSGSSDADSQVRATEDASLQDDTYSFDEGNTDNEDIHDVSDFGEVDSDLFDSVDDSV